MQPQGVRNYMLAVTLLVLLGLAAFAPINQPASSQPAPASQIPLVVDSGAGLPIENFAEGTTATTVWITATDPTAAEAGLDPGEFKITRSNTSGDLRVRYAIDGSASNGTDYEALSDTVTIASGTASVTLPVVPIDDSFAEGDETVVVTLIPFPGYTVGLPESAIVTIIDDDLPGPVTPTPTPAPQIRISTSSIGRPWQYLWDGPSGRLFEGPNTTGQRVVYFNVGTRGGRIHRGANATGEILFTVDFNTGRIWAGPNPTGPLLYTLSLMPSSFGPEVRVHEGSEQGPIIYNINGDNMYEGPNATGELVFHASHPIRGPVQFLLPLIADRRIP